MSDVDDLFDDDDEPQQQQPPQQELADSPQQQQQRQDGMEDLEDDMGEEQQPDEADLFGSPGRSDEEAAAEAAPDEPTGEPITVSAPLLKRWVGLRAWPRMCLVVVLLEVQPKPQQEAKGPPAAGGRPHYGCRCHCL
jgi:hypothetical protein